MSTKKVSENSKKKKKKFSKYMRVGTVPRAHRRTATGNRPGELFFFYFFNPKQPLSALPRSPPPLAKTAANEVLFFPRFSFRFFSLSVFDHDNAITHVLRPTICSVLVRVFFAISFCTHETSVRIGIHFFAFSIIIFFSRSGHFFA